ncbi:MULTISPECIES: hypothetical protein [Hyphomicrobiales]|jgi:uncharacterized membrane protein|uniref:Uncharacterized protein n=1 Tax=Bosea massiliensis TaxID=151419 RepID=A0ABW0P0T5_9HYPH|nr:MULTISPECIES: hypothetical protein [Hyphomicrobiales]
MLIVLFSAALASGALTLWLAWPQGVLVALVVAAVVASVTVSLLAIVFVLLRSRTADSDATRPRGLLDILARRQAR